MKVNQWWAGGAISQRGTTAGVYFVHGMSWNPLHRLIWKSLHENVTKKLDQKVIKLILIRNRGSW